MLVLALLIGMFSVAVGSSSPFYGLCKNVTTVKVNPSEWDTEMYGNIHRFGEEFSCEYLWNSQVMTESGESLLYNTWSHTENGVEHLRSLHASYVRDGVYKFIRSLDDGTEITVLANILYYEPNKLLVVYVCCDDAQFAKGEDQVYIDTDQATAPTGQACKIKKILEDHQISTKGLGLVNNCGCEFIPYDSKCKGYTAPSMDDFFGCC